MKRFTKFMRVRADGAVTIPKSIRTMLNIKTGARAELEVQPNGSLLLSVANICCPICGESKQLSNTAFGVPVCEDCIVRIEKSVRKGNSLHTACNASGTRKKMRIGGK